MPNLNLSHSGNMQITSASILGDKLNVEYEENTSGAITGFSYNPPIGSEFVCGGTYTITAYPQFSGTVYTETFTVSGYDIDGVQRSDSSTLRQEYDTDLTHYDIELSSFGGEILSSSVTADYVEFELRIDDDYYAEVDITPGGGEEIPYPIDNITTDEPETGYVATSLTIVVGDTIVDSGRASANYSPSRSTVSLVYSSSAPEVASINSRTGEITVYSSGTVQFCVYDEISELQDCKNVAVDVSQPDTSITITSLELIVPNLVFGEGYASASYAPANAAVDLHYTSQNPAIASIDETTGEITVNYKGIVTFCVTDTRSGLSDCKQVRVNVWYIDDIQIVVDDNISGYGIASSIYTPSDARVSIKYSSSNPEIATIDEDTGVITVNQNGVVTFCVRDTITNLSDCKAVNVSVLNYNNEYLTFQVLKGGNIYWISSGLGEDIPEFPKTIQYSLDRGHTWTSITSAGAIGQSTAISVETGDIVFFKGTNSAYGEILSTSTDYHHPEITVVDSYAANCFQTQENPFRETTICKINVLGNIMSLIYGDNFIGKTTFTGECNFPMLFFYCLGVENTKNLVLPATAVTNSCYREMFLYCENMKTSPASLPATTVANECYVNMFSNCTSLTTAPSVLPATTLADNCYAQMFLECTSLTSAPVLPATTLAGACYASMFAACQSLTTAPELPATTLAYWCYEAMFAGCAITSAPTLPATTLADSCYLSMFSECKSLTTPPVISATTLARSCCTQMFDGCTSLTTAPVLLATTLAPGCYAFMFRSCTSLTRAPELPAAILVQSCYAQMFDGCSSLNYIKCLAEDVSATTCTTMWVKGVAQRGTFIYKRETAGWQFGVNGIPNNWSAIPN